LPISARQVPVTRPTYPVPITQMTDTMYPFLSSQRCYGHMMPHIT
jgi:hypothetical protein